MTIPQMLLMLFVIVTTVAGGTAMYLFKQAMHTESTPKFFAYLLGAWAFSWTAIMLAVPSVIMFWSEIAPVCGLLVPL